MCFITYPFKLEWKFRSQGKKQEGNLVGEKWKQNLEKVSTPARKYKYDISNYNTPGQ